ncbi:MAG: hypothetical protein LBT27_04460 [Prevotellaceae bacterium]|jgi:hypothetical protein|nr:hypothetical protein [Prevotellaceae bacterium]
MELLINGKQLELSTDFAIEMEETNPFFNEQGSQSIPGKAVFSMYNLTLLGHPERIQSTNKINTNINIVIRHGVFQRVGKMVIFSASKSDGIEFTIYFNDGEFYTKIKDVKMRDINFIMNADPFTGSYAEKATAWLQHFEQVQSGQIETDYVIFPVATKITAGQDEKFLTDFTYEMLNEPDTSSTTNPYKLLGYTERLIDNVQCPVGYGVTPFLKLNYLLRSLFLHFNYSLLPSLFDTDDDLSKIVVLNNNADTICSGKLDYKQLVPTCTITDFIECIQNKFCCIFVPDSGNKTVAIRFFQTPENLTPDADISKFVVETPIISHEPFKQIKLSAGTTLESAEPAAETLEQLVYENIYISEANESQFATANFFVNEIVIRKSIGKVYKQISEDTSVSIKNIGSVFFNYDKKTADLEYDERNSQDEQTPLFIKTVGERPRPTFAYHFPLIGNKQHLNTGIKEGKEISEEKDGDCKIMFCFDRGMQSNKIYLGTPLCYDLSGNLTGNLSLQYAGAKGLFIRFWKEYDALLRHAFRKINCKLNMPVSDFLRFNICTPKLINGTPVLPVNIKYNISNKGIIISEAEFLSLRLLKPYNLEDEQRIPEFNTSQYYWIRDNNRDEVIAYAKNKYGSGIVFFITEYPPDVRTYQPPTEAQYNAGGRYHVQQCACEIRNYGSSGIYSVLETTTYTTWLEPKSK